MRVKPLENNIIQFQQIQSRLTKFSYLSKQALPGLADAQIFQHLKSAKRIPARSIYQNFYHWYITIAQFADKQINSWKQNSTKLQNDKIIIECITIIDSMKQNTTKQSNQAPVDYIMNIFVKVPLQDNMTKIKNKLAITGAAQIGQQLKVSFKNYQQRYKDMMEGSNQLRVMFKLKPVSCEKFQKMVLKWVEVENIQVRRQMKQSRISSTNKF